MEVIKVHHPLLEQQVQDGPVVVAMGFFDGVHRGHQAVIARAKEEAVRRQVPLAVLTYDKLPGIVYQRYEEGVHYLTTIDRKLDLLEQLGANLVYLVDFTAKLGSLSPEEFVSDYLVRMHAVAVVAGFDHTYGKKDVATMDRLIRTMVQKAEIPLEDAVRMASETPARIMGVSDRKGTLQRGKDADIVLLDRDLNVRAVWAMGKLVEGTNKLF